VITQIQHCAPDALDVRLMKGSPWVITVTVQPISCPDIYLVSFKFSHAIANMLDGWHVMTDALPG